MNLVVLPNNSFLHSLVVFMLIECVCLMLIPLEWFCGCAFLLTFNYVIFDNMNSVEITLPQSLDRFRALVYDYLFMVKLDGFHN